MSTYLLFNLVVIVPAVLGSVLFRHRLSIDWRAAGTSIVAVAVPFLLWDWWATRSGHWNFVSEHLLGWRIAGVPIEEIFFFVTVPLACLIVLETVRSLLGSREHQLVFTVPKSFLVLGLLSSAGVPLVLPQYGYTALVSLSVALYLLLLVWQWSGQVRLHYIVFISSGFGLFLICNQFLTSLPIVTYAPSEHLGIRVGSIPVEDFAYNFVLLSSLFSLYTRLHPAPIPPVTTLQKASTVFKKGSTTYYTASALFPPQTRNKVTTLYAFVRIIDDFVDQVPADAASFRHHKKLFRKARSGTLTHNSVIDSVVALEQSEQLNTQWLDAFWLAMELDMYKTSYATRTEVIRYMYGSAEVVGLLMAALLNLPALAYPAAAMLGRAMQYCNFIRDIAEDTALGRTYIPQTTLHKFGITQLSQQWALAHPDDFTQIVRQELLHYYRWQTAAEHGFQFIPWKYRLAIATASAGYRWTADVIWQNPLVVFERKVKPSRWRILLCAVQSIWYAI